MLYVIYFYILEGKNTCALLSVPGTWRPYLRQAIYPLLSVAQPPVSTLSAMPTEPHPPPPQGVEGIEPSQRRSTHTLVFYEGLRLICRAILSAMHRNTHHRCLVQP